MPDSGGATVLDDLPESVVVDEILVRLPAEDVLRCRAVRKSWRRGTSTQDFLLANHRRQPSLPVIDFIRRDDKYYDRYLSVVVRDAGGKGTGTAAASRSLSHHPVLWFPNHHELVVHAACDGLLVVSFPGPEGAFDVCNPVTRRRVPLRLLPEPYHDHDIQIRGIRIAGFYRHLPSGEHR